MQVWCAMMNFVGATTWQSTSYACILFLLKSSPVSMCASVGVLCWEYIIWINSDNWQCFLQMQVQINGWSSQALHATQQLAQKLERFVQPSFSCWAIHKGQPTICSSSNQLVPAWTTLLLYKQVTATGSWGSTFIISNMKNINNNINAFYKFMALQ